MDDKHTTSTSKNPESNFNIKSIMSEHCRLSEDVVAKFHDYIITNIFNQLPAGVHIKPNFATTTFSYLGIRYLISHPDFPTKALSINILGARKLDDTDVYKDHFRADFAYLVGSPLKPKGVKVFEGDLERFNKIFYSFVLPYVLE